MKLGVPAWSSGDPVTYNNALYEVNGDDLCAFMELGSVGYGKWKTRQCAFLGVKYAHACMVGKGNND